MIGRHGEETGRWVSIPKANRNAIAAYHCKITVTSDQRLNVYKTFRLSESPPLVIFGTLQRLFTAFQFLVLSRSTVNRGTEQEIP